jgi:hypothetical protein
MALTSADTRTLFRAVEQIHRPSTFLLDRYFPEIVEFDTETIDFDVISKGRKLAPFVHQDVTAKPVRTGGYQTKSFRPAYVKPFETISPGKAKRRRAGEAYMGEMSASERLEAMTIDALDEQRTAIIRRKEWMAAQALDTGEVIVEGEDYPRQVVEFGRADELQNNLTGSSRWGEEGVSIIDSIEAQANLVQQASGIAPTDVIFDPLATTIFRKDPEVREVLDNRRQTSGSVELGPVAPITGGRYIGTIGSFDFWTYQDFFEGQNGELGKFIPDFTMWLTSPAVEGVQAHGAIEDADLGLIAAEYAPSVWNERNPSKRHAMTQSAPLVVPTRVNHSARLRVR